MFITILSTFTKNPQLTDFLIEWHNQQTWPKLPLERYTNCLNNELDAFVCSRPTSEFITVSDTIPDFDAQETIITRHLLRNNYRLYEARRTEELLYAAETLVSLQDARIEVIMCALKQHLQCNKSNAVTKLPSELNVALQAICTHTKRILLNCAPRNHKKERTGTTNGDDFYLAITDNLVEVYCVPVQCLEYIQHRIMRLYKIPTSNHPLFHDREQFRSSVVGNTGHLAPEHLELVWSQGSAQSITDIIGDNQSTATVAFVDKFNNRRLRVHNLEAFWHQVLENSAAGRVQLRIGTSIVDCEIVTDLANITGGNFGIYKNVADTPHGTSGYIECNRRLNNDEPIWATFDSNSVQNASSHLHEPDRGIGVIVEVISK